MKKMVLRNIGLKESTPSKRINPRKYSYIQYANDGDEYATDIIDELTKLRKDIKAIIKQRPSQPGDLYDIHAAIEQIIG